MDISYGTRTRVSRDRVTTGVWQGTKGCDRAPQGAPGCARVRQGVMWDKVGVIIICVICKVCNV